MNLKDFSKKIFPQYEIDAAFFITQKNGLKKLMRALKLKLAKRLKNFGISMSSGNINPS